MKLLDEMKQYSFFKGLSSNHYQLLAKHASNVHCKEGEYLFQQDGAANIFYLVCEGEISLEMFVPEQGNLPIQTVKGGQIVGWSWLFPPYKWHFSAKAVRNSRLIAFDAKTLREELEANHDFGYELMKRFSFVLMKRLQATRKYLFDLNRMLPAIDPWWDEDLIP